MYSSVAIVLVCVSVGIAGCVFICCHCASVFGGDWVCIKLFDKKRSVRNLAVTLLKQRINSNDLVLDDDIYKKTM